MPTIKQLNEATIFSLEQSVEKVDYDFFPALCNTQASDDLASEMQSADLDPKASFQFNLQRKDALHLYDRIFANVKDDLKLPQPQF